MKHLWKTLALALCLVPLAVCAQNPATVPAPATPQIWAARWNDKLERVKKGGLDLLLIGDSITHAWDSPENQGIWNEFYAPRNAISLGFSGARTENILWMLDNGIIDGIQPKVAVVMIGTNNSDGKHFPTGHTGEQIAGGIEAIVKRLRDKLPRTKILILRIFPRADIPGTDEECTKASAIVSKLADKRHVFFLDIRKIFLKPDGTVDPNLMPDLLHPNTEGYRKWANAMEPTLRKLMGKPKK